MIQFSLPKRSFIGGWFINDKVCDALIKYFNNTDNKRQGMIEDEDGPGINIDKKDCTETPISPDSNEQVWYDYKTELKKVLDLYIEKYPDANNVAKFRLTENTNIQYYKPGGGFKTWHTERETISTRHLVFMTYLNDVDDGGTEFKNQKIKLPAKKGLTVMWPTDWTHTHRGVISNTQDKYIITGWFNYV